MEAFRYDLTKLVEKHYANGTDLQVLVDTMIAAGIIIADLDGDDPIARVYER